MPNEDAADLLTIRDLLRHAVSRFNAAGLVYGHGTVRALDEAAFLILETLHLPIDELDPWLDARLTRSEREAVLERIDARIRTRKPASYLTGSAYIQGRRFYVDERVIVPRSYIGELLGGDLTPILGETGEIASVLDLCTGSGCLAILAALAFPDAAVEAVDISGDALAVARRNVADYGLDDRVRLYKGDLFAPLGKRRFDLILSNPPYVPAAAMAALPPEFRAEPALALAGGEDGLDIVRRILAGASRHLAPGGHLIVEIGTGRDHLLDSYPDLPFLWLDTEESEGEVFHLEAGALARR
jgi:ribosomal protein L3 glutamine methyltransferase